MKTSERVNAVTAAHIAAERRTPVPLDEAIKNATYRAQGDHFVNHKSEQLVAARPARFYEDGMPG